MSELQDLTDPRSSAGNWVRHQMAGRALERFAKAMADEGIEWMPVKGVVTASQLYDDPSQRPMGDIDIRVRPRDFRRVIAASRARGWPTASDSPQLWQGEVHVDGWSLDVEGTVGPPGLCRVSVDSMIRRAVLKASPFGFTVREPEFHDHALLLCLNAFKDLLLPKPWATEDLLRIGANPSLAASVLAERARAGRVTSAVWLVADWLAQKPRGAGWRAVCEILEPEPRRQCLARAYRRRAGRLPGHIDLFVVGSASDDAMTSAAGALLTLAGLTRGGVLRRLHELQRSV